MYSWKVCLCDVRSISDYDETKFVSDGEVDGTIDEDGHLPEL